MSLSFSVYEDGKRIPHEILLRRVCSFPRRNRSDLSEVFNFGFFESLRTYGGKIFRLEEHLDRLIRSAKTAGFWKFVDQKKVRAAIAKALETFFSEKAGRTKTDVFVRLTLWGDRIFVMIGTRRPPGKFYREGIRLKTTPVRRSLSHASTPEVKTSAYLNPLLAYLEPVPEGIGEWLFVDREGFLTEASVGNLFVVKEDILLTPPCRAILNGVTRRFVIECALQTGIFFKEIPLMRHDVFNADEAFLTNTSWEILPIAELDGRSIGAALPGPVTGRLQGIFRRRVVKGRT